ncbi:DUF2231 domain-containing protein [Isoptericola sp. BMS4]|uniref:DUF2231 domain-containing protein n=1 Tax=Isoptericola sp. BMS4 TaxID=2527875 RepID=UPI00141EAC7A|nr:DUF2231 domain-containing protein [Isoptericola sp. BMS4]
MSRTTDDRTATGTSPLDDQARRLERATGLDALADSLDHVAAAVVPRPGRLHDELRGRSLGHPAHGVLTDLPVGLWAATALLDVTRPTDHRPAARRLLGLGVLASVPTALTGLTDFNALGPAARRVAAVHAAVNGFGNLLATGSWLARRRGRHGAGTALTLGALAVAGAGAYLGGHIAQSLHEPTSVPGATPRG